MFIENRWMEDGKSVKHCIALHALKLDVETAKIVEVKSVSH